MPVDARGKFDASAGEFSGINVYEANKGIIEKLRSLGLLLAASKISHSYPHCWRCKNPIIFRATKQWFMVIDHDDLRKKLLGAIEREVRWVPGSGKERISAMVELRPDWCLSRQRYWGVPVPSLVCDECKEEFFDSAVIGRFAQFIATEGSDCWFSRDIHDFLPEGLICPVCKKGRSFSKGADILDVWFDSGVSSQAVLKKRKELAFPAALYLEGSDQHRGWFQSSLIPAMAIDGRPPYKTVLTHGFVVDAQGKKMSKSLGNVISPFDVIKDYGADILRMWVASSDYNEDIRISKEILKRLSEAYRKVRNTARFILSNLYDFDPDSNRVSDASLTLIDTWILSKLRKDVARAVEEAYERFEFYKAYKAIYDFCNEELSMGYLDMAKGRLYTYGADSVERRAAQTAMYEVLGVLVRMMAPVLAFTAEEIWQYMPMTKKDAAITSVHLLDWPVSLHKDAPVIDEGIGFRRAAEAMQLRPDVAKVLEELRGRGEIGSSFDAKIILLTKTEERYTFLRSLESDLCEIFKVSQVEVKKDDGSRADAAQAAGLSDIAIIAGKAQGAKCARCWNYKHSVGATQAHPSICNECVNAIGG